MRNSQVKMIWKLAAAAVWLCGCQTNSAAPVTATMVDEPQPNAPDAKTQASTDSNAVVDPLHPRVKIVTSMGEILIEADAEAAPVTVLQFMNYVEDKYYDGTIFHRVMKDSVIQGGGYTPDLVEKTHGLQKQVKGAAWQSDLDNRRGTIAMLRGKGPGGGGTGQFYINVADNTHLDMPRNRGLFAVFGKIVEGDETVERIRQVPVSTHANYAGGRSAVVPVDPVIIKSVSVVRGFSAADIRKIVERKAEQRRNRDRLAIEKLEAESGNKSVTLASGVKVIDIMIGAGPPILVSDTIMFNYEGMLVDDSVFETTLDGEPKVIGVGDLVEGLRQGILNMNEGGSRYIIVPPDMAYGEGGIPGLIPANSTLIYRVEVLEIR